MLHSFVMMVGFSMTMIYEGSNVACDRSPGHFSMSQASRSHRSQLCECMIQVIFNLGRRIRMLTARFVAHVLEDLFVLIFMALV
jgi:hypothetical protein